MEHDKNCVTRRPDWVARYPGSAGPAETCPHCVWLKYYRINWNASLAILLAFLMLLTAVAFVRFLK